MRIRGEESLEDVAADRSFVCVGLLRRVVAVRLCAVVHVDDLLVRGGQILVDRGAATAGAHHKEPRGRERHRPDAYS